MDMETNKIKATYNKEFDNIGNFNSWYDLTKKDVDFIVTVLYYDPSRFVALKAVRDAQLLRVSREVCQ
jgi:hypothetical protein